MGNDIKLYDDLFEALSTVELEFPGFEKRKYKQIPLDDITFLGSEIAFLSSEISNSKVAVPDDVYKVVNPIGRGKLSPFNDGSGLSGNIKDESGKIIKQARLIKVDSISNPNAITSSIALAVSVTVAYYVFKKNVLEITKELNYIEQMLLIKDEARLESKYLELKKLFEEYPLYAGRSDLLNAKRQKILDYQETIVELIAQFKRAIISLLKSKDFNKQTVDRIIYNLQYYLLSIKVYSMALYLEIIYSENYNHVLIQKKKNDIIQLIDEYHQVLKMIEDSPKECYNKKSESHGKTAEFFIPIAGEGIGALTAMVPALLYTKELIPRISILEQNERINELGLKRYDLLDCITNTDRGFFLDEENIYLIDDSEI